MSPVKARLQVPALTLHDVWEQTQPVSTAGEPFYRITAAELDTLIARFRRIGYRTISSRQFRAWQRGDAVLPERPLLLTFDDGYASHFETVTPLLVRARMSGTFFVTTGFIGQPGYVTWEQLRKMVFLGMEIGAHGHTHRLLTRLSAKEVEHELAESRCLLESQLGVPIRAVAAPGGFWGRREAEIAKRVGYDAAWVSVIGLNRWEADAMALRRLPVHQPLSADRLAAMADGRRSVLWPAIARQKTIGLVKRTFGVAAYERLKRAVAGQP